MFDSGTIRLVRIAGIPVRLHWSFVLIFFWVGFNAWKDHLSFTGFLHMQLYVLILFACVVMHEYGHALMARRFGNQTKDILLTPIGGIARLEGISEKPIHEFWIAIAGPMVNIVIAIVLAFVLWLTGHGAFWNIDFNNGDESFLTNLIPLLLMSNIVLALFNLIPAFPMDGGRVLRALLATRWPRYKATLIAARIGQSIAAMGFLYAVSQNQWMLCLVSTFIFFTAGSELKQVQWESVLNDKTAGDVVNEDYHRARAEEPMRAVMETASKGIEKNYLVFQGDILLGYLPHHAILYAIKNKLEHFPISAFTKKEYIVTEGSESLRGIYQSMQQSGTPVMPVLRDGNIIGMLEETQIRKYVDMLLQRK